MKKKELKTLWKVAKSFWISGTLFWIVETIIFLIYEGWHLKPTNPIEKFCDNVVASMWRFALYLTLLNCFYLLVNLNRNRKRNNLT